MPKTYEPIQTQTLGSAQTSITFSSIPATYTDLVFITENLQSGGTQGDLFLQFNSDSGTNYSRTYVAGNGTSAFSDRLANQTKMQLTSWSYPTTTTRWVGIINIQNYSNTTTFKTVVSRGNNASAGTEADVGLWRSTTAINTIVFSRDANQFATGSTFTLYGIKAA